MKKLHKFTNINTQNRSVRLIASLLLISLLILILITGFNFIDNEFNGNKDMNLSLIKEDNRDLNQNSHNDVLDMIEYHKYDEYLVIEEELKIDANRTKEFNTINDIVEKYEDELNNLDILQQQIQTTEYEENLTQIIENEDNLSSENEVDLIKKDIPQKAKLVIIMDDVSFGHQIRDIEALGLDISMSFLPPNTIHPRTSALAKNIDNYMVHLPLEALKYPNEEDNTLNVIDSESKIETRIKQIREWFPKAKYINNHTGSKFTADEVALKKLFQVLEKYDFKFIDSRTTPNTKVKVVSEELGLNYIRRDVFLDNKADVEYIKEQLRKVIKKAKKRGVAIAICHPRKTTIEALSLSSEILEEVELININKLNL